MKTIAIANLNDGINVKNDASVISDGSVVDCIGFDLTKEGVLEVAQSLAANDISTLLPSGTLEWVEEAYIGSQKYIMATTPNGLYANGILIKSDFTGRFRSVALINNIYLVNGSQAVRFDGTTCYKWGITAPTTVPTIAKGTYLSTSIEPCTDLTTYIANQSSCTVSYPTTGSNLITNGTFTGSAAGWTVDAVAWTYNANKVDKDADGTGTISQTIATLAAGTKYLVSFTISGWTVGSVTPTLGGTAGVAVNADGTYYQAITPVTAGGDIAFAPTNTSRFSIDDVTLYVSMSKEPGTSTGMGINVAASTLGYTYRPLSPDVDLTEFSTGTASTDKDYIRFWLRVDDLKNLSELALFIDVGDGTFTSDVFSYSIVSPGAEQGWQNFNIGSTQDVISEERSETSTTSEPIYPSPDPYSPYYDPNYALNYYKPITTNTVETVTITHNVTKTIVDPVVSDQVLSFWRRSRLFSLKSGTWTEIKIPKSLFIQKGDQALDWDTVCAVKFQVTSSALGAVNVYIDDVELVGGSDLVGDYWFLYTWGRADSNDNIIHESAPSRNTTTRQINIVGPVYFDRHPFTYSARPLSTDAQVNCGVFYFLGGGLTDFWALTEIMDNSTTSDTIYSVGEQYAKRKIVCKNNEPAPNGTDIVVYRNKIWMVGDEPYPSLIRSSDILADGTVAPEAWPPRNSYDPEDNHGALTNISVLNEKLSVKGDYGEWTVVVNDPTDYLQVSARKITSNGLLGQDAVVKLPNSHIYPTSGGFVESNGSQASFVLPEVEPLIDQHAPKSIGVNAGLISYFTHQSTVLGYRTAKVDLYRGKPRFSNLNDKLFDCLYYDKKNDRLYGVYEGTLYIVDYGYTDASNGSGESYAYLKSKVYRPGPKVGWTRMNFPYNTGGNYFRLEIYVDDVLKDSRPFYSTSKTEGDFRFGPYSGFDFQFIITGDYRSFAKIYFPIRIYHSG